MSGPHHDPSNRQILETLHNRSLDQAARIESLERYVKALVEDRGQQRRLVEHVLRLVAQKEALLAAIGRRTLDAAPEPPVLKDAVPTPKDACKHQWIIRPQYTYASAPYGWMKLCSLCGESRLISSGPRCLHEWEDRGVLPGTTTMLQVCRKCKSENQHLGGAL